MEFCVLGSTLTTTSNQEIYYTDTHWEGKIGEMLFYESALSDTEMKGVSEFLRKKWISTADLESPRTSFQWGIIAAEDIKNRLQLSLSPNPAIDYIRLESSILGTRQK